jgi:hypothetical protein
MNWKFKTVFFKSLSILNNKMGDFIYHEMQKYGLNSKFNMSFRENLRTYDVMRKILSSRNFEISDSAVLEIGTGWFPFFPYLLIAENPNAKVCTVDLNKHMTKGYVKKVEERLLRENLINNSQVTCDGNLNINIDYKPNTSILDVDVSKIDLVFSRFVLEHVPPELIEKIHVFLFENLPNNARILHLISPSDHRSYSDRSLSHVDFLKYSQVDWDKICTRFDYHNRLRINEYVDLFKKVGFEIEFLESEGMEHGSKKEQLFKELKLDKKFESFSDYENIAGAINVLLKKT